MTWKTIPGYRDYEMTVKGEIRDRNTGVKLVLKRSRESGKLRVYIANMKLSVYGLLAKTYIDRDCKIKANSIPGARKYLATDDGKIYSLLRNRYISQCKGKDYMQVGIHYDNGEWKTCSIHRLVALALIWRDDEDDNVVNHIDHNKLNNDSDNLEWTTTGGNRRAYINFKLYNTPSTPMITPVVRNIRRTCHIETDMIYISNRQ